MLKEDLSSYSLYPREGNSPSYPSLPSEREALADRADYNLKTPKWGKNSSPQFVETSYVWGPAGTERP